MKKLKVTNTHTAGLVIVGAYSLLPDQFMFLTEAQYKGLTHLDGWKAEGKIKVESVGSAPNKPEAVKPAPEVKEPEPAPKPEKEKVEPAPDPITADVKDGEGSGTDSGADDALYTEEQKDEYYAMIEVAGDLELDVDDTMAFDDIVDVLKEAATMELTATKLKDIAGAFDIEFKSNASKKELIKLIKG